MIRLPPRSTPLYSSAASDVYKRQAYVNDVMQYPNQLPVYIGFALCFAAPHIDKRISEEENTQSVSTPETDEQI